MTAPDRPSLARFATRHAVLFNLLFVVFLLAGGLVARRIPVDAYPDVELDAATIMTVWLGASPEEVDTLVTSKIEDELEGIRGIDRIVSDSRPNRSNVLIKFEETLSDAELDRAFQDIRAALERVEGLPADAEEPVLRRQTVFEIFPLATVAVSYRPAEREPVARAVARQLREELLALNGVAKVGDRGIRDPEYAVLVDREKAERYDLTLLEIAALLEATNRDVPAGEIELSGGGEIALKAAGNYRTRADVERTVIRQDPDGSHVRVGDVARVTAGFEERDVVNRYKGRDAITLPVSKEHDENSLALVDDVRRLLDDFRARGLPEGVGVGVAIDSSQIIRDRLRILTTNLGWGVLLIFLVLWTGIGVRNAVLAVVGIPFCFLTGLMFMDAVGVSVNAISLFAMVLVSGVIVDDALIVLENIYRRLEEGLP
ncbi:MAG: efflux RND transporter permease subunit, partial [Planctomycetota bacterium]